MFSLNCPLKLPGFSENLNVLTHFSTAPNTKFHEYSFSSLEMLHANGDIQTWRTQHAHFNQFWIRISKKEISKVSNRVSQRPCHKPASYPTKTPGRQNSKGYRHVRSVQTLLGFKMPKATESISRHQGLFTLWRCKFAPGELLRRGRGLLVN